MNTTPAIGIDLGTTFSCVSVYRNGKAEVIPNIPGRRITPSVVFYDPDNGEVYVGDIAEKMSKKCPSNCLRDAKRFIGRQFDDEFISRYISSTCENFTLVSEDDGQVAFQVQISNKKVNKKIEEVSAEVLKYLRRMANNYLGGNISKAVVSVPAYFSNAQRKATKKAAELAGLEVLKLVTEPTAAAIHYVSEHHRENSNILVFDFGGGTLDISVIKVSGGIFEVKAVYGDTTLGGRNFDQNLFDFQYKIFQNQKFVNLETMKFKRKLYTSMIALKKMLSNMAKFGFYFGHDGKKDIDISMTRSEFEELNKDIFSQIRDMLEYSLEDSGLSKSDINEVILVGGSTRIPKIQEMLETFFGFKKIRMDLHPDEAVAVGASINAAVLLGKNKNLEMYKVTEVTPMSLGISVDFNRMYFFIRKNSAIPTKVSRSMVTCLNDQDSVNTKIYEGERKDCTYNNFLGSFDLKDLPKRCAGDVAFDVTFSLDEDGILTVTATEPSTGKNQKRVLTMGQYRLSEKKIKLSQENAKKYKSEDDRFEYFGAMKVFVNLKCNRVLYDIEKITSKVDQNYVKKLSYNLLREADNLPITECEKIRTIFEEYKNSISGILKNNSMLALL